MKRTAAVLLFILCLLGLTACGQDKVDESRIYKVYYLSNSETKVEMHEYEMQSDTQEEQLQEMITCLSTMPEKLEYKAPLAMGFSVKSAAMEEGTVLLDVDSGYEKLPSTTEVLVRAAIVRTLTQLSGVRYVGITVEGNQLFDNLDKLVGLMSADQFIDNEGKEINTYEKVRIKLYFANEAGDRLVPVVREKEYNTNVSLERLVVEELIKGPSEDLTETYPTVNPATKVVNVMTKDGICYVNLDDGFLTGVNNTTADVTIFSIVNSLVELSNVNKVQISVNGETPATYREKNSFNTVFERNLDLIANVEQ